MHALIVGERGVGKSTLIRRVLKDLNRCPIYIYDAGKPHCRTQDNLIGYHRERDIPAITAAFDRYAPRLLEPVPEDAVAELDEIGFLEANSESFCQAVMGLLDGANPVIAAVKDREHPFLEAVRNHLNARCFYITAENRDALYEEVLLFMKQQLEEGQ